MTASTDTLFDEISADLAARGEAGLLDRLAERFRTEGRFHELFDVRLLAARRKLGLAVVAPKNLDDVEEPLRTQLEQGYLDACREVGGLLLERGQVRHAWAYLRPVGDRAAVAAALAKLEPNEENTQEIIELSVHEGIDPRRGFELVLASYGTCNAITMFDSAMHQQGPEARAAVAGLLVRRVHTDLMYSLSSDIARQQGSPTTEKTIRDLATDRDWLFGPDSYHIDTSHLHAVVRFARYSTDREIISLALDLTEYGRRLSRQFQFPGEEPFADSYPTHAQFFAAQLGQNVEPALSFFRERAESSDPAQTGPLSVEVYVTLLARLGRTAEALDALGRLLPPEVSMLGLAPSLGQLAAEARAYARLAEIHKQRGDAVGYAAALLEGKP